MQINPYTFTDTFEVGGETITIDCLVTEYVCEHDGDSIPLHKHSGSLTDRGHSTKVLSGELEVFYRNEPSRFARPGDPPFVFAAGREHGLRGKQGTRFESVTMRARIEA